MTEIPPQAITDAAEAVKARHRQIADATVIEYEEPEFRADIVTALEAAAPHIAAAERDATVNAMYAGAAKAIENAVAAERERIAKLAKSVGARYQRGPGDPRPFADLLREVQP